MSSKNWNATRPAPLAAILAGTVFVLSPAHALAQAADSEQIARERADAREDDDDRMVVTARKREENLLETPAAISALPPEILNERNISNIDDVGKHIPNLNVSRFGVGNTAQAAVFIRGIGLQDHIITTDPGVGVYLDGVYLGRQMGSNLSLVNIERIEVLRGPQGTLYGRNSLGGAINIITTKPGREEGMVVNVKGGSRDRAAIDSYGQFPLTSNVAVGVSSYFKRRDGVGKFLLLDNPEREVGEEKEYGGRITANWDVNDRLSLLFSVDGMEAENGQSPYQIQITGLDPASNFVPGTPMQDRPDPFIGDFPALQPDFPFDLTAFGFPELIGARDDSLSTVAGIESTSNAAWGTSITADLELTPALSARFIGSYRYSEYTGGLDDDESPLRLSEFPEDGEAEQISLELQLAGQFGDLDFVSGLYYFNEDGETNSGPFTFSPFNMPNSEDSFGVPFDLGFPTGLGNFDLNQETDSYAIYANVKYGLTERLTVGGGLRYSKDDKEADALFPSFPERTFRKADFEELTWDINATLALASSLNAYAQIQKGYQTGGFPPRPFGGPDQFVSFDEQTAINYEIGLKGDLMRRLVFSFAAFWTEYDDLALPFSDTQAGGGFVTIVENAGESRSRGFELEADFEVIDGFHLRTAVGYLDAEIRSVKPGTIGIGAGDSPALTPEWTLSIAPSYRLLLANGGALQFNADYSYRDEMFGQSINNPNELMDSRELIGFTIDYHAPDGSWSLGAYGENITNEVYDVGRLQQTGFVGVVLSNDRRELGVRLTKHFGGVM
ncbi:MAG: TonB-dependent receptor [Wenzhouxiangellaceae bacterium]|nr:TonB-dependent receptor [Wenzhouxiangellaceae bacterium]